MATSLTHVLECDDLVEYIAGIVVRLVGNQGMVPTWVALRRVSRNLQVSIDRAIDNSVNEICAYAKRFVTKNLDLCAQVVSEDRRLDPNLLQMCMQQRRLWPHCAWIGLETDVHASAFARLLLLGTYGTCLPSIWARCRKSTRGICVAFSERTCMVCKNNPVGPGFALHAIESWGIYACKACIDENTTAIISRKNLSHVGTDAMFSMSPARSMQLKRLRSQGELPYGHPANPGVFYVWTGPSWEYVPLLFRCTKM